MVVSVVTRGTSDDCNSRVVDGNSAVAEDRAHRRRARVPRVSGRPALGSRPALQPRRAAARARLRGAVADGRGMPSGVLRRPARGADAGRSPQRRLALGPEALDAQRDERRRRGGRGRASARARPPHRRVRAPRGSPHARARCRAEALVLSRSTMRLRSRGKLRWRCAERAYEHVVAGRLLDHLVEEVVRAAPAGDRLVLRRRWLSARAATRLPRARRRIAPVPRGAGRAARAGSARPRGRRRAPRARPAPRRRRGSRAARGRGRCAPRFGRSSTSPLAWSLRSASRTGVRLTPNSSASASWRRRVPDASSPLSTRAWIVAASLSTSARRSPAASVSGVPGIAGPTVAAILDPFD